MAEMIDDFGRRTFDARDAGPTCYQMPLPLPGELVPVMSEV